MSENTERIRALNDALRKTFQGGRIMLTCGVDALPEGDKLQLLQLVRDFDSFDPSNDPHQEHDFLSVEMDGQTYFAKIDYYDPSLTGGSEDPADPAKTTRVLTIMKAFEY